MTDAPRSARPPCSVQGGEHAAQNTRGSVSRLNTRTLASFVSPTPGPTVLRQLAVLHMLGDRRPSAEGCASKR
jgi:hypothetical protein